MGSFPDARALIDARFGGTQAALSLHACVDATDAQMRHSGTTPHRILVTEVARSLGWKESSIAALARVMDCLQVCIDVADNLADWEADAARGRVHPAMERVAPAVRPCLPAVWMGLAAAVFQQAVSLQGLSHGQEAWWRLQILMAEMAVGQGHQDPGAHLQATSGRQGLLLLLPLWMDWGTDDPRLAPVERWAEAYGRTWELHQQVLEAPGPDTRRAFDRAMLQVIPLWPDVPPFQAGQALEQQRLLPRGLC